jgi:hypothetical protein
MAETNKPPSAVTFHYVKANHFRVIHGDGIIGCVTPRALIHFAVFSERQAIPQTMTHTLSPDGKLGEMTSATGKDGIVRELETDVFMNLDTARTFHQWLGERVKELENIVPQPGKNRENVS